MHCLILEYRTYTLSYTGIQDLYSVLHRNTRLIHCHTQEYRTYTLSTRIQDLYTALSYTGIENLFNVLHTDTGTITLMNSWY